MNVVLRSFSAVLGGAVAGLSAGAVQADPLATQRGTQAPRAWASTDFTRARPMLPRVGHLPDVVFDYNAAVEAASSRPAASVGRAGHPGGDDPRALRQQEPVRVSSAGETGSATAPIGGVAGSIETQAVGSLGMQFTSSRLFPNSADTTYPTRTVGKLYFRDPADNLTYVCSGAMIQRGVVLTSGHCVHNGAGRFYTDFRFRPGMRNGTYPYGTWSNWTQARTTASWLNGGGTIPNRGDWATIVFGPDSTGRRIGNYTGWLGYTTNFCSGKHLTTLGYPANLDSGLQMQRSDSQSTSYGSLNNCTWGSDMRGGSSGGPVISNLEVVSANSSSAPSQNTPNRIVSTVSWGYTGTSQHVQGGSILNSEFSALVQATCAANTGACQ